MNSIFKALLFIALLPALAMAAVAENGSGTASVTNAGSVTTISLSTFTVDAGSSLCLVGFLMTTDGVSSTSMSWDSGGSPQSMTSRGSQVNGGNRVEVFVLVAPTTGNKNLTASWTTGSRVTVGAVAFSGADQSTCINTANTATNTGTGTSLTQTVTSTADGATVAGAAEFSNTLSTSTQTEIWVENTFGTGGSYALGGASNNHTWAIAGGGGAWVTVGVNVIASSGGSVGARQLLLGIGR